MANPKTRMANIDNQTKHDNTHWSTSTKEGRQTSFLDAIGARVPLVGPGVKKGETTSFLDRLARDPANTKATHDMLREIITQNKTIIDLLNKEA